MKCDNRILRPMLRKLGYCMLAAVMLACGGGGSGDDPVPEPKPEPQPQAKLEVKPAQVAATAEAGSYTVDVTATAAWSATCDSSWCVTTKSGNVLTLKVAANAQPKQRQTIVKVVMDALSRTVTVTQAAGAEVPPADKLEVEREELTLSYQSGEYSVSVTSNVDWSVSSDRDWCTAVRDGEQLKIRTALNTATAERPAVVTVRGGTLTRTVRVNQQGITLRGLDSLALVAVADATGGQGWKKSWDRTQELSRWTGVRLNASGERVEELMLRGNNLAGGIPAELFQLTGLKKLDLGNNNNLQGSIPEGVKSLKNLEYISLDSCQLSGTLPEGMMQLTGLRVLDLGYNHFSGDLPVGLSSLSGLVWLRLAGNQLGGILPESWKALRSLVVLDVSRNAAEGEIPASWLASLLKTEYLYLHGNRLEGPIPESIVNLYSLHSLALDNNKLTGGIPAELGYLPQLSGLWLYNNHLTGEIPESLRQNSHWQEWQPFICPQLGDGFTDGCPPAVRSGRYAGKYPLPDKNGF